MSADRLDAARAAIRASTYEDEAAVLRRLVEVAALDGAGRSAISSRAADLVRAVRGSSDPKIMESFLAEYGLSSKEGVALMCLAEALLRVPDSETIDDLIRDKIVPHDWSAHSGESGSVFVNASTWALMLTGRVLDEGQGAVERTLRGLVRRLGEPVIRRAVATAMRELGDNFVLGRNMREALSNGRPMVRKGYLYSFDMLGEAALTEADARRYHRAYADAIAALAAEAETDDIRRNPGISVKLSALHPRYEVSQAATMLPQMAERLLVLCEAAKAARIGLNIDAEEAERLDLSLDVIEAVLAAPSLAGWDGFGVVVQAYGRRASHVLDWLHALADRLDRRIMVRLVKGAYWDSEVKKAQAAGLPGYPVFTRKANTDVSYIANARKLLAMTGRIYPQFATHNAHTVAAILAMAPDPSAYEFQRLHGMGEALHETVRLDHGTRCRIYAPVGAHEDLLAYLVRRLLENGANSSFVHQIVDEAVPPEAIARDPFAVVEGSASAHSLAIPAPSAIFLPGRANSAGYDISNHATLERLDAMVAPFAAPHVWMAAQLPAATTANGTGRSVMNPAAVGERVGTVFEADAAGVASAVGIAVAAQPAWAARPAAERAAILRRAAGLFEANAGEFFALCAREAGKNLGDRIAELREAVDFLHYYAAEAPKAEAGSQARGVIACISPWNFPLAIFTGQVAAALAAGNAVVAKPAEQTPLIACRAVELLHEAGVPAEVLHLVPGDGEAVGAPLTADPRIAGVCFTGSTEVARIIERQLAATAAPDAMLIAETGGLNAMIVDSTALPEQAVRDAVASAFRSAGQRCSALRILYVQKDVEAKVVAMLKGAMEALVVGDPWKLEADVGPLIDDEAQASIADYCAGMTARGKLLAKLDAPAGGRYLAPHIFRVSGIGELEREVFGPVLHVATFAADELDRVISDINARGYGLTFGLHTRIDARVQHVLERVHAGNIYVNRNQIGAVVGSQPFGGEGLSGTGPKAGGPHYLPRFRKPLSGAGADAGPEAAHGATAPAFPGVPESGDWAQRPDRIAVLRKLLRGRAADAIAASASLDFGPVDLPGPTGEANALVLVPRGAVLCLGHDGETLLAQVVQALAAGNAVLAVAPGAGAVLSALLDKGLPLAVADGIADEAVLREPALSVVAFAGPGDAARALRIRLAGRPGAIARLVTDGIDPRAYVHERSICVDTTAAGGNASLLAAAE
jgi:RHH-type proline utilization regulon transcriptional repressor/proline dehydrogenase/delta 1-pyrroline-5-carboxylate dehydrogenase